ncbi:MAG: tetratricopeptide repeat protein [Bryobacteraceae bacterium]
MRTAVRVKERSGAWRQLSLGEVIAEASLHLERGDNDRALNLLEKAAQHAPRVPVVRYLLGVAQVRHKRYRDARSNFERAVEADEGNSDYQVALGVALMEQRPLDAIQHLSRAVELGSKKPEAYSKLATLFADSQKPEEALRICDLGLAAHRAHPGILASRGVALTALGRSEEALECLQKVEALLPQDHWTMIVMAGILLDLGRLPEARTCMERACALEPDSAEAHFNLGLTLLLAGDYLEGFREYEWRWRMRKLAERAVLPQPAWDGSELEGRRILLLTEQGAGDTIQFVRYVNFVRARGGRAILPTPAPLVRLMGWLEGVEVAPLDLPLPPFEVQCHLLSLPRLAATDKDSVPPPAEFVVPPKMKQKWSGILGERTGIRVGIVWAGTAAHKNDRNRSIACRQFAPLTEIPLVQWFSLQVGPAVAQLAEPGTQGKIRDLAPELTDYAETAAAISQLDVVITVDTSVAHLAGSLGAPVWVLIPFAPDWRWLLERDDSPWYPGMRLFRQQVAGDWESVMNSVANALRQLLRTAPAAAPAVRFASGNSDPALNERARLAADFIPAGAIVLDLGCGSSALENYLPSGCRYMPRDVMRRDERKLRWEFDEQPIPRCGGVTHITALGVLEFVHDWPNFLRQLRSFGLPVVLSYCPTDFSPHLDRGALGWANHLSLEELCRGFAEAGFHLQSSQLPDSNQVLLRIAPAETRMPVRRRVLVMSGNNGWDRLGFHLIDSLMPAGVEVHHGHFQPWEVPHGDFDLLVLGTGDSVFHPILSDQLMELVCRIPRSVGIFGTQYREGIDRRRMTQLLDRLTVWFARYEEDLLLYGAGRRNAVHLGDWLIGAFPMTRWNRDETLHVDGEGWKNLPLDRAIEDIRRYRNVVSEAVEPLLCAMTSAERVAYREQRDGSGNLSGRFRSLLIDIFGRTWPESNLFEFPREAVAAYRARTMRVMSGMPLMLNQLLEIETGQCVEPHLNGKCL